MQRRGEYQYGQDRVSFGYVFRNMMTIGLVVAVMYHFIVK